MKKYNLSEFTKGWFIGNFNPSLLQTDLFEVAIKNYTQGDQESAHYHKIATEYTIVNSGRFRMNDSEYGAGDIIVIEPGESTDFYCLESGNTTVLKVPCVSGDKFITN